MKTEIILKRPWTTLANYDFLITMSKGDVVDINDMEYIVDKCLLDTTSNSMKILVN